MAAQIRKQIVMGELAEGDLLPSEAEMVGGLGSPGPRCARHSASLRPSTSSPSNVDPGAVQQCCGPPPSWPAATSATSCDFSAPRSATC